VLAVDAAPDGRRVATTGTDGTTHLWDPASGLERLTLQGDEESVHSVAFSDDGMRLVTGDIEGITRVWALDLDDLIGIAKDKLTRELTDAECREYLHLDACPPR
jgi:WD40 repeat protein